ncbi:unnamed protein product [Effrenium voratum]|nr:unnamed protein product [Effrenium voratum]
MKDKKRQEMHVPSAEVSARLQVEAGRWRAKLRGQASRVWKCAPSPSRSSAGLAPFVLLAGRSRVSQQLPTLMPHQQEGALPRKLHVGCCLGLLGALLVL